MVMCDISNHDIIIKVNFQNVDYDRQINRNIKFLFEVYGQRMFYQAIVKCTLN